MNHMAEIRIDVGERVFDRELRLIVVEDSDDDARLIIRTLEQSGYRLKWQRVEDASVASTGRAIEKSRNPLIRMVMEIIQRDSLMHYRVQQLVSDSLERETVVLSTDELAEVWDIIESHIKIEKKTIELAEEALGALKGKKMIVQEYLLNYLLNDEKKHDALLADLESIKKGMYPYA